MPTVKHLFIFMQCCFSVLLGVMYAGAQATSEWEQLFDQGKYCQLAANLERKFHRIESSTDIFISNNLLLAACYLELERWSDLETQMGAIASFNPKIFSLAQYHEYQLLKAQQSIKLENWHQADSIFTQLLNIDAQRAESRLRGRLMAEYGLYLLHIEDKKSSIHYLQAADSLAAANSVTKAKVNNALGFIFLEQSSIKRGEKHILVAREIWEKLDNPTHPYYIFFLNDYALFQMQTGDLRAADSLLSIAEQQSETSCINETIHGYINSNRARLLFELGDHEAALQRYQDALGLFSSAHNSKEAAIALFNIAEANFFLNFIDQAHAEYQEALNIMDAFHPKLVYPFRAQILLGLASIEEYNDQDQSADSLYALATDVISQTLGQSNVLYATAINNYARFKEGIGDFQRALEFYHQTEKIDLLVLGSSHPDYNKTLYNLARCYSKIDSITEAVHYYRKANHLQLKLLRNNFKDFEESARLSYRLEAMGNFDVFFSYACPAEDDNLAMDVQNINLATKNLALDYARMTQNLNLSANASNKQRELFQSWLHAKKLLTRLYFASTAQRLLMNVTIPEMEEKVAELEKQITRLQRQQLGQIPLVNFEDLRNTLLPNAAAIDYFNYHVTDEYGQLPDSILYYALVTTAHTESPQLVYLCTQRGIRSCSAGQYPLYIQSRGKLPVVSNHLAAAGRILGWCAQGTYISRRIPAPNFFCHIVVGKGCKPIAIGSV